MSGQARSHHLPPGQEEGGHAGVPSAARRQAATGERMLDLLQLQRAAGNRAVSQLLSKRRPVVQQVGKDMAGTLQGREQQHIEAAKAARQHPAPPPAALAMLVPGAPCGSGKADATTGESSEQPTPLSLERVAAEKAKQRTVIYGAVAVPDNAGAKSEAASAAGAVKAEVAKSPSVAHVVQGVSNPVVIQRKPQDATSQAGTSGIKRLAKGYMCWALSAPIEVEKGGTTVDMLITFIPDRPFKTITFLQTVKVNERQPVIDMEPLSEKEELDPFYGANWDSKQQKWVAESSSGLSAPSGARDNDAHLHDTPYVFTGMVKRFESVAVVAETSETLGALRWGFGDGWVIGGKHDDCTDTPSAEFGTAVGKFYATPKTIGPPDPSRDVGVEHYEAILDGFMANDGKSTSGPRGVVFSPLLKAAILTADQENKLDPIIAQIKALRKNGSDAQVLVSGFADPTEMDPHGTSEQRAQAVKNYLAGQGVPRRSIGIGAFGAGWARYPPSVKESRNRRVQVRMHKGADVPGLTYDN